MRGGLKFAEKLFYGGERELSFTLLLSELYY